MITSEAVVCGGVFDEIDLVCLLKSHITRIEQVAIVWSDS